MGDPRKSVAKAPRSGTRIRTGDAPTSATVVPFDEGALRLTRGDWLIFTAALGLRLLYVLSIHHAYFFEHLQTDALRYQQWATLILDAPVPPRPPFEQSPGYPYLVAAVFALCGRSLMPVACLQAGLDALTCVLIAAAGRYWFGARAGWIAGSLAALYGPFIYFSAQLLPVTPFVFLCVAALCAALRARWWLAGILWGAALVMRAEVVFALPLVGLDAWRRGRWLALARSGAPLIACVAFFVGINAAFSPHLVLLTTSGGENLWLGNNPHADGVSPFAAGPLEAIAEGARSAAHNDAVLVDQQLRGRALAFWRAAPAAATRLLLRKFVWTWTDRELPNTSDIDWETAHSWLFRPPLFPVSLGMILPFALAGALLIGHERRAANRHRPELELLGAPLLIGVAACVVFFTNARFRLIMVPSLLWLAGNALARLPRLVRQGRGNVPALALLAIGCAVGTLAAWGNFDGVRHYRIPQISVDTGIVERESGDFTGAVRHLREGLADDPQDGIAWVHLALALEQGGDVRAALNAYLDGLVAAPGDDDLQTMAGRFCNLHHLDTAALHAYAAASSSERAALRLRLEQQLPTRP